MDSKNEDFELDFFEISMSNLCNLQCVYCRPEFSSRWEEEFSGTGGPLKKDMTATPELEKKRESFWALFDKSDAVNVRLIGGEPFINPDFFPILERIAKHPKKRMRLTISSNLNFSEVYLQRFLEQLPRLLEKFEITLIASMESTGKFAEYIRYGLSWSTFCRNYEKLAAVKLDGFDLGTRITLNVLAAKDLYSYLEYLLAVNPPSAVKKSFECGNLVYPGYLQVALLPVEQRSGLKRCLELKDRLLGVFEADGIRFLEESLNQAVSEPYVYRENEVRELKHFLEERKKHWGVDFMQLVPEFSEVLRTR